MSHSSPFALPIRLQDTLRRKLKKAVPGLVRAIFSCLLLMLLVACSSNAATQGQTTPVKSPTVASLPRQDVSFTTADQIKVPGWFWDGGGSIGLICSHESYGGKQNWAEAAPRLAGYGYKVLAFDFRGFGASTAQTDKAHLDQDMLAAIAYMQSHGANKIILIGASLGGIISTMVAAQAHVAGVITLSGGYYREQAPPTLTVQQVRAITVPKLIIASKDDPWSDESSLLYKDAIEPKQLHLYPGTEHGTNIFDSSNGPDLYARIVAFVKKATV